MGLCRKHKQPVEDEVQDDAPAQDEGEDRGTWGGKLDFVMSALSFAVGMGNLWRFPYMCYRNGGGAFLIPYGIMAIFAALPLIFLEFVLGQYAGLGVVSVWRACPLFQGIGWTMFAICFISGIYYNMLIAYSFFYTFASFASDVPWRHCGNWWNTPACREGSITNMMKNCTGYNGTWFNDTCYTENNVGVDVYNQIMNLTNLTSDVKPISPSDEYFHKYVLDISEGLHDLGGVRWQLALCLLLCWVLTFLGLTTGVKSLGKATYVTSIFPYVILMILLVRGLTLEGSAQGVIYYLTPQWHRLASAKVWGDAAVQVFFSMSCCFGGLITLASYNRFNNNCLRDAFIIAAGDCFSSIFGGVVIFAIMGYMSHQLQVPIDQVATQGGGLAYIVYPEAVTSLPVAPLWAILFMLMLVNLGIGTQFTLVATSHTVLLELFPNYLMKGRRSLVTLAGLCVFFYLIGLTMTTRAGIYILQLMDTYAPSYALLVVGLAESVVISWVYGLDRLVNDIEQMLGSRPHRFWLICWKYITPALIVFILLFTFIDFKRSSYGDYTFPVWADVLGWAISLLEIGCIPAVAVYQFTTSKYKGPFLQKLKFLCRPTEEWGPTLQQQDKPQEGNERQVELETRLSTECDDDINTGGRV